jgi:cytochrome c biogenesis protein ResB
VLLLVVSVSLCATCLESWAQGRALKQNSEAFNAQAAQTRSQSDLLQPLLVEEGRASAVYEAKDKKVKGNVEAEESRQVWLQGFT